MSGNDRIYNLIPGERIDDGSSADKIFALLRSVRFEDWQEVNEEIYNSEFFRQNDEFYVMYLDPCGIIKCLYVTLREDIISFMREHMSEEYGDGVDIAVCTKQIDNAVICNHDGQMFLLKNILNEFT